MCVYIKIHVCVCVKALYIYICMCVLLPLIRNLKFQRPDSSAPPNTHKDTEHSHKQRQH